MRIVICGAGKVGFGLAQYLSTHGNHVTVVDSSRALIARLNDHLDVKAILGHATHADVLRAASVPDAEMFIAVTQADETNMVACLMAHTLFQVPTKIARIRSQAHFRSDGVLCLDPSHMPIDVVISPEAEVAMGVARSLAVSGAFDIVPLADGRIKIIGVRCGQDTPIVNTPIRHIHHLFPGLEMTVIGIIRGERKFIPVPSDILQSGDQVFFAAPADHVSKAMAAFGFETKEKRRLVILGGGNIGLRLAQEIEKDYHHVQAEIIERSMDRATLIAENLSHTTVLCGDALDSDILRESRIDNAETVVAVTDNDQVNGLASVLAKRLGAGRALCLINNVAHNPFFTSLGIDGVINPQKITISRILHSIRQGRVRSVHSMGDDFGEIIEANVLESSGLMGTLVSDLNSPGHVIVAALIRGDSVVMPTQATTIDHHDRLILMTKENHIAKIEQTLAARLDYY